MSIGFGIFKNWKRQFLSLWKPDNIFLVDSEIWPNLILNAKKFNIPIALINARLARILTNKDYDSKTQRVKLWTPATSYEVNDGARV